MREYEGLGNPFLSEKFIVTCSCISAPQLWLSTMHFLPTEHHLRWRAVARAFYAYFVVRSNHISYILRVAFY